MSKRRVVVDLCCGRGGWTKAFLDGGWHVIGIDIKRYRDYPGNAEFILSDLRELKGEDFSFADLVVSSPPCTEFSKLDACALFPDQPLPDMSLVVSSAKFASNAGRPLVLENVRGLQLMIGAAVQHYGSFYLWGDGVPPLMPYLPGRAGRYKLKWKHRSASLRAVIPYELARWVAEYHANPAILPPGRTAQAGTVLQINPYPRSLPPVPYRRAHPRTAGRKIERTPADVRSCSLFGPGSLEIV